MFANIEPLEGLELLVLDFKDAFKQLHVSPKERRYLAGRVGNQYFVYLRLLFGVGSGPLVWGRVAAWIGQSTQAILGGEGRVYIYVDDPLIVLKGTAARRNILKQRVLAWWCALGLKMAWVKGQHGERVEWIGARIQLLNTCKGVQVSLPDDKLQDYECSLRDLLLSPKGRLPVKSLKSCAGKGSWIAGILPQARPFVQQIWGALAAVAPSRTRYVQLHRVKHALTWLRAFCLRVSGFVRTCYLVDRIAPGIVIEVDASPWGGGAAVWSGALWGVHASPSAFIQIKWTQEDANLLSAQVGAASSQATW